jgi:LmbE family N-acetylglucosaminyl deacetylase
MVLFAVWSQDTGIEVDRVAQLLGYRYEVLYGAEYEARLLEINRRELVGRIESYLHAERPAKVLLPSPSYHQDHNVLFEAGLAATRPLSRAGYIAPLVAAYEYPGSAWRRDGGEEQLNYYLDITSAMDTKLAAVAAYGGSQAGRDVISPEIVESWARLRGRFVGVPYAEAFKLMRLLDRL